MNMDIQRIRTGTRADFARYARLEYGRGHVEWFLATAGGRQPKEWPIRAWLRGLARGLRRAPASGADSAAFGSSEGTFAPDGGLPDREGCPHADLKFLGRGGTTRYFRCSRCGAPFVVQDSRMWTLRPTGDRSATTP